MAIQYPDGGIRKNYACTYEHLICHLALAKGLELGQAAQQAACTSSADSGSSGCQVDLQQLRAAMLSATTYTLNNAIVDSGARSWRYSSGQYAGMTYGDISHMTWAIPALYASQQLGAPVPSHVWGEIRHFFTFTGLSPVTDGGVTINSRSGYWLVYSGGETFPEWTTYAFLGQIYTGVPRNHSAIQQFMATRPQPGTYWGDGRFTPLYVHMHGSHLGYLIGGAQWQTWNTNLKAHMAPYLSATGHEKGSYGNYNTTEQITGGRTQVTAITLLSMEPYFAGLRLDP
jgi:hypothetical protein